MVQRNAGMVGATGHIQHTGWFPPYGSSETYETSLKRCPLTSKVRAGLPWSSGSSMVALRGLSHCIPSSAFVTIETSQVVRPYLIDVWLSARDDVDYFFDEIRDFSQHINFLSQALGGIELNVGFDGLRPI